MIILIFFFKQKTAYEMRISDWSSDVCSSDLVDLRVQVSICRCKWRSKCCRRRIDTIELRAGAIAVEKLKLLGIGQTIAQPSADIGLAHRNIVKHQARCQHPEIGRASCREGVYQDVKFQVVGVTLKKKKNKKKT